MQAGLEVPVRLCVTDLDGCLLDASGRLPEGFFETVERCGQRGVTVCAASGRSVQGIKKVFGPASDRLALISDNGGRVFIRGEEQVCRDIPRALWAPVAALARECGGVHTVLTLTEGAVLDSFRALSPREAQELEKYYPKWSPEDLSSFTGNAVKLSLLYFGDIEREILPRFACFGERGLAVRCTAPIWIDVNRADVDKSDGVRDLQRILNVSPRETAVFGDYLNDLSMADCAGWSFAPANAHPEVRKRFNRHIGHHDTGSVQQAIRLLAEGCLPPEIRTEQED